MTRYNRQDMTASCPPVRIGDEFKFEWKNCIVTKLYDECFSYEYINPSLRKDIEMRITYKYWQECITYPKFSKPVLLGGKVPRAVEEGYQKRELNRILNSLAAVIRSLDNQRFTIENRLK